MEKVKKTYSIMSYIDPSNNREYFIGKIDGERATKKYTSIFNLLKNEPKFKRNYKPLIHMKKV